MIELGARVKRTVEIVANAAIVVVCCALGWSLFVHRATFFGSRTEADREVRLEGQVLPGLRGYSWTSRPRTLVLAIRGGCEFCEASLPFYKRLGDLERSDRLHAHVLAVMPDDQASAVKALQAGGVAVDGVFNQPIDSLKVSGTPTLLFIDTQGRVTRSWVGQLNAEQEQDVIAAAEN